MGDTYFSPSELLPYMIFYISLPLSLSLPLVCVSVLCLFVCALPFLYMRGSVAIYSVAVNLKMNNQ